MFETKLFGTKLEIAYDVDRFGDVDFDSIEVFFAGTDRKMHRAMLQDPKWFVDGWSDVIEAVSIDFAAEMAEAGRNYYAA